MEINEGDAKITPEPLKAPVNSSVSERMKISESTVRKEINVNLVSSQGTECRFWVGLTKAGKITPKELLELGDIGKWNGKVYQVVGRMYYTGKWTDWDSEDSTWWTESWDFEEWVLVSEDKSYIYLSQDKEIGRAHV